MGECVVKEISRAVQKEKCLRMLMTTLFRIEKVSNKLKINKYEDKASIFPTRAQYSEFKGNKLYIKYFEWIKTF